VQELAGRLGAESLVVIFGLNEPARLEILATTFKDGDPSYAGPLAGVALGIPSYHAFELKDVVPADAWQEHMAIEELEAEDGERDAIVALMRRLRGES
jgi:betaine reductase